MAELKLKKATAFKVPMGILGADLSPTGDQLVAACMDGVYVANLKMKTAERIGQHASYASSARFLANQDAIISAGYDGALQWFRASTGSKYRHLPLHQFWSWDMAVSPDESMIASVTGQYLAGGYKYEPLPERERSVRLVAADSGKLLHSFEHVPSVQAVSFSPDSNLVAAGNLMGEVRVWDCQSGKQVTRFTTPDFTSWGIIKSHCYLGGIFALRFTPDGKELLLAGMGPMRDPMAGNGRQLWQKWAWSGPEPKKVDETHKGESGEGLMETLAVHPDGKTFAMGGRLRGGDWNVALFELGSGARTAMLKTGYRVTEALFTTDGKRLVLTGMQGQPRKKDKGAYPDFGRIEVDDLA